MADSAAQYRLSTVIHQHRLMMMMLMMMLTIALCIDSADDNAATWLRDLAIKAHVEQFAG